MSLLVNDAPVINQESDIAFGISGDGQKAVEQSGQSAAPAPIEKKWWSDAPEIPTHCLAEVELKAPEYILRDKNGDGLLPVGLTVISGDPKASKSTILRAFLSFFSSDQDQLESEGSGECLILTFEDDQGSIQLPDVLANGGDPRRIRIPNFNCFKCSPKALKQKALAPVAKFLSNHPRCKVVVVDVLSGMLASLGINSNSAEKARSVLEPLHHLGQEFGVSVVVLHHNHKAAATNQLHKLAGSIQVAASARLVWMVHKHPENENLRVLRPIGGNIRGHSKGLVFAQEKIPREIGLAKAEQFGVKISNNIDRIEFYRTYITDDPMPELKLVEVENETENAGDQCAAFMTSQLEAEGKVRSVEMEERCLRKWTKGTYNRARHLLKEKGFKTVRIGKAWFLIASEPEVDGTDQGGAETKVAANQDCGTSME